MLGNEAVARGLYEAGVTVASSYPGTPSTEITEFAALYEEINAEWAPNEKVAAEAAIGASIDGSRSFCAMKHVGLNVAADPLYTASYTGVNGGLVFAVADDPGMHSSQNEQDSRHHAIASKVAMVEPSDSAECKEFTKMAYDLSEQFDTPVIIRLSTRVSHSQSLVEENERADYIKKPYVKNIAKYVMMPAGAKPRHVFVEERTKKLIAYGDNCPFNKVIDNKSDIGVISSGAAFQYAAEALGDSVNYLKIGLVTPLPEKLIRDFAASVKTLYVIEELDDIIETHCKKMGLSVIGKELFSFCGELSQAIIAEKILKKTAETYTLDINVPVRPPVMCAGCPHRGVFSILNKLKLRVSGDIGCYTLGASAPLSAVDTTVCMGASVSGLHGMNLSNPENAKKTVAVIGDSTFMHSGITGLVNICYNRTNSTVIVLDNSITGMTGHQQNPATGITLKGDVTAAVNIEALCKAVGIRRVRVCDPYNLSDVETAVKEEIAAEEPSVIIARRPCALLKNVKHNPAFTITDCRGCKACLRLGCPAIFNREKTVEIDKSQCVGCGICKDVCKFNCISEGKV
ncbi:MAG: indolepyruvate ferredoxin oxidoreductase subunit alpha [Ruminococcus sp.]|nr:indolepyruvate ferredoxin oxidoreductase subunit alpha [Ruminococcus sp.]